MSAFPSNSKGPSSCSECPLSALLPRHHVVSQRRNSVQGVQLFGSADAHHNKVADVAIVAGVRRRMSFFRIYAHARARGGVITV